MQVSQAQGRDPIGWHSHPLNILHETRCTDWLGLGQVTSLYHEVDPCIMKMQGVGVEGEKRGPQQESGANVPGKQGRLEEERKLKHRTNTQVTDFVKPGGR